MVALVLLWGLGVNIYMVAFRLVCEIEIRISLYIAFKLFCKFIDIDKFVWLPLSL